MDHWTYENVCLTARLSKGTYNNTVPNSKHDYTQNGFFKLAYLCFKIFRSTSNKCQDL